MPDQATSTPLYTEHFFQNRSNKASHSSEALVPWLIDLFRPLSVIDVGCGTGDWLKCFKERGIDNILGLDGDYVPREQLRIPPEQFRATDLSERLILQKSFDLAISLEVAEHLPPERAESFVVDLCALAPVVVFSAAIPFQGGTGHINEQWQDYWAGLFIKHGRVALDCICDKFWNNRDVACHYAQNALAYVEPAILKLHPEWQQFVVSPNTRAISRVHPETWLRAQDLRRIGLKRYLTALPDMIGSAIRKRL